MSSEKLYSEIFEDFEKAKQFFRPSLADLHDPWMMKDMQKAVDRIIAAINKNEKIVETVSRLAEKK